ncbi:hypothetical protein ABIB40_002390 [Pedobacter sp. UYP30]|uniref:hypothetical protein n=1 Tax=Pedobacter sp. UYP30 TaxID=1756400 RepID=UPI00339AFDA0
MFRYYLFFLFGLLLFTACNNTKTNDASLREFTFAPVKGIRYTEVKRRFSSGLSFNPEGFMQKPSWIIEVAAEDTMLAWSPQKQMMQRFYMQYDHGDVYNFAAEFFKVQHVSKDSMVFRRVEVEGRKIVNGIASDVNMTFYAQNYIKNKLKTTVTALQKPSKEDTAFVKRRAATVNKSLDSAFAATTPVKFIAKNKTVSVEKISTVDPLQKRTEAYDYMFPQYEIKIDKAYKDFYYLCNAIVDFKGHIHIENVVGVLPENAENKKKVVQAIADIYLYSFFTVQPGTTLGIPHNSQITFGITGKAAKKP